MATPVLQRAPAQYDPLTRLSSPLIVPLSARRYDRQFASLYDYRLRRFKHPKRGRLLRKAIEQWQEGKGTASHLLLDSSQGSSSGGSTKHGHSQLRANYVKRILDVKQGQICFVIGTIYCSMHLKPDVLEELTREQYLPPQPPSEKYADPEKDEFFVEDESGRVRLVGDAVAPDGYLRSALITGVVVAVLGTETRSGDFEVADALFAGVPEYSVRSEEAAATTTTKDEVKEEMDVDVTPSDGWVAIVSGLETDTSSATVTVSKTDSNPDQKEDTGDMMGYAEKELRLMMLTDWILGHIGDHDERDDVSEITSLIIAGNSVNNVMRSEEEKTARTTTPAPRNSYPTSNLDDFLVDLASSMHVHLLPGEKDPTSLALPQQPMHRSLFPKAARFDSVHSETNPTWIGIHGKRFLGSSGQNINDIFKYMVETSPKARLQAACNTLEWGHIAPTAPDTLSCYPLTDRDPFLIEEAPDIYFVGNQEHFATQLYEGPDGHQILVVLVPIFATTGEIVLVQPSTLKCKRIQIGCVP